MSGWRVIGAVAALLLVTGAAAPAAAQARCTIERLGTAACDPVERPAGSKPTEGPGAPGIDAGAAGLGAEGMLPETERESVIGDSVTPVLPGAGPMPCAANSLGITAC
ncbi:hypothetical protein E2L08_09570 [Palleronia sediminis]|uniref:Uncharacterized protein n=1 Tax=Palleronia sediminis TaxID=2547833 RepID=A0A4R6A9I0_9RHOB|nr:hypothetical protein [Palleronia sediminis]TDL79545.1 hypothetical protein E2L08_09570 [Palleronia sediminis]